MRFWESSMTFLAVTPGRWPLQSTRFQSRVLQRSLRLLQCKMHGLGLMMAPSGVGREQLETSSSSWWAAPRALMRPLLRRVPARAVIGTEEVVDSRDQQLGK